MPIRPAKLLQRIRSTKESILDIRMAQSSSHSTKMNMKETSRRWCSSIRTRSSSSRGVPTNMTLFRVSSSKENDIQWMATTSKSLSKTSHRATTTMSLTTSRTVVNMNKTILWLISIILTMPSLIVEWKQHPQPKRTSKGWIARFKQLQLHLSLVARIWTSITHRSVELARTSLEYIRMEHWVTKAWLNCKPLQTTWRTWRINRYTMMRFIWRNINKLWCRSSAFWRKKPNQSLAAKEMHPWARWDQLRWEQMLLSDRPSLNSAWVGHTVIRLLQRHLHKRANRKPSKVNPNNPRWPWMTMSNFKSK